MGKEHKEVGKENMEVGKEHKEVGKEMQEFQPVACGCVRLHGGV